MSTHEGLWEAYKRTSFRVDRPEESFTIRLGEISHSLDALLREHGLRDWAYLTACNPGSQPLSVEENEQRQRALISDVQAKGYPVFQGAGQPDNADDWAPEASILVLGIPIEEAIGLGSTYGQVAIVAGQRDQAARLVSCP